LDQSDFNVGGATQQQMKPRKIKCHRLYINVITFKILLFSMER